MKEFKGTKGPWIKLNDEVYQEDDGIFVCSVSDTDNARLIGAAPELLEALQKLLYSFNDGDLVGLQVGYKIEAESAISKALGE